MKLVCPSCESGFLVDAAAIGPTGRKVRCGRCGNSWLAMPVECLPDDYPEPVGPPDAAFGDDRAADALEDPPDFALEDRPEDAPEDGPEDEPGDAPDRAAEALEERPYDALRRAAGRDLSPAPVRSTRRRPHQEPAQGASIGGWMLFAVCVVALASVMVLGRKQIMAWAPETEPLYVVAGLAEQQPVPPMPRIQLRLREVTSGWRRVNGTQELVIEGEIFNPTDQDQDVPPLVATLMDPTGIELKRWVFAASTQVLPPGGRVAFQTSTPDPPGQGNLNLNFVLQRP